MTRRVRLVLVAGLAVVLLGGLAWALWPARDPLTFYISPTGSNDAAGTSPGTAWRTLGRLHAAGLRSGDRVLLEGGAVFAGQSLTIPADAGGTRSQPITLGSYGTGRATVADSTGACVTIASDWVRVRDLITAHCTYSGFAINGDHVTIADVESSGSFAGITIRSGADHAVVRDSYVHDNTTMRSDTPGPDNDSGAFGILVNGDHALVTGNTISGQDAPSADFGTDGSAVEIFGAEHTVVSYNVARDNHTFTELGATSAKNPTDDTLYAYNQITSTQPDSKFVVTRGAGRYGPVTRTRLLHNTAVLSGASSEGVICGPACSPKVLSMEANLIYATHRPVSVTGSYASRDNLVSGGQPWCARDGFQVDCLDRYVGTLRIDDTGRYVTLRAGSAAIDAARADPAWTRDIAGQPVPVDGNGGGHLGADVGAWERPAG